MKYLALEDMAKFLQELNKRQREKFDIDNWGWKDGSVYLDSEENEGKCMTSACAGGYAAVNHLFGLSPYYYPMDQDEYGNERTGLEIRYIQNNGTHLEGWRAIQEAFGITSSQGLALFEGGSYDTEEDKWGNPEDVTVDMVTDRIAAFLKVDGALAELKKTDPTFLYD